LAGCVREPAREALPVGQEQRDVIEAGVPVVGPRSGLLDECDELTVRAERGRSVLALEKAQADRVPPVVERALEVGDGELDRAHPGLRRDGHSTVIARSPLAVLER